MSVMLRDGTRGESGTWCGSTGGGSGSGSGSDHEQRCERVHRTLKRIMKARCGLDAAECAALREAQKLMIWRAHGCASLVEYMTREMGYTERAAVERLRVAKVIEEVPALGEALNQGDLSFSGARELARVITNETQNEWLGAAQDLSVRQIEQIVSGHKLGDRPTDQPDPALKTKVLRHEVTMAVAELESRARKALARMRGSSVDDSAFMETCFKAVLDQCEGARAIATAAKASSSADAGTSTALQTGGKTTSAFVLRDRELTDAEFERLLTPRYQLGATICTGCKRGWQHGADGTTLLSPPELERVLCDCTDIGCIDEPPGRAKRSIPKPLKRQVFHRDGFKCRVPGCNATANIDCHHLEFLMNGGKHTLANCLTLCEGHHLALHEGSLLIEGDAYNARFTFRPQNKLKIATRAVECAAALRARGVAKELIKAAVEATRTHVGQHDLTTEQWTEIALTKLLKPSA